MSDLCPHKWWDKKQENHGQDYPGGHPYHLCIRGNDHAATNHLCSCGARLR